MVYNNDKQLKITKPIRKPGKVDPVEDDVPASAGSVRSSSFIESPSRVNFAPPKSEDGSSRLSIRKPTPLKIANDQFSSTRRIPVKANFDSPPRFNGFNL